MERGVIYAAKGAGYLDLAQRSAASLRALEPDLPIDLFTDQPGAEVGCFDRVIPLPEGETPKLSCLHLTRFARTLYLDCDTRILAPLGDLFALLDRFDLALTHDVRRTSALIREGDRVQAPYAFPQMNSGVMLYRGGERMQEFWAEWRARYRAAGRARDQISLRDLLWESDLRFYILPEEFNLRRVTLLDAWEPLDVRPTILHSHRLLQHMRGREERLDDLGAILAAERAARGGEWRALGFAADAAPGEDGAGRFHRAESLVGAAPPDWPAGPAAAAKDSLP